jgi:hypothetical protein
MFKNMTKEEIQLNLLKMELELVQRQMDKYDQLSVTTKTWTVTLWIASLGWYFQIKHQEIIFLAMFVVILFWFLDSMNKNLRQGYKRRRDEIATALQKIAAGRGDGSAAITPSLPVHRFFNAVFVMFQPHVAFFYLSLVVVGALLYMRGF